MHVVHIIWHLDIGGGEVFLRDLVRELAHRGISQHVFAVGPAGRLAGEVRAAGVPVSSFGKSSKLGLLTILRMAAALGRLRPSVVQTHGDAGALWGLTAARLAGVRAVSLVYRNADDTWLKTWAVRCALGLSATVIAGSRDVAQYVRRRYHVPAVRLRSIYCGIEAGSFVSAAAAAARPREGRSPVILTIGRLVPEKGHRVLIDALPLIRRQHPDARLIVVGDGPERSALEARAASHGLTGAVEFRGTVYPTHQVLASADVFVFPSLIEPQGLAVLEAFAAGVPVVASSTGGIPEMVEDGVDGILSAPADVTGLAAAVIRMLDDPPLRQACVEHARRRLAAFDVGVIADEHVAVYASFDRRPAALAVADGGDRSRAGSR